MFPIDDTKNYQYFFGDEKEVLTSTVFTRDFAAVADLVIDHASKRVLKARYGNNNTSYEFAVLNADALIYGITKSFTFPGGAVASEKYVREQIAATGMRISHEELKDGNRIIYVDPRPTIRVTVSGPTGVGKSTVVRMLYDMLNAHWPQDQVVLNGDEAEMIQSIGDADRFILSMRAIKDRNTVIEITERNEHPDKRNDHV